LATFSNFEERRHRKQKELEEKWLLHFDKQNFAVCWGFSVSYG